MPGKLTNRQKKFCHEYLVDLNATQAAIRAGYREKTARVIGAENLTKPYIKARIEELQAEIAKRNRITTDYLVNEFKSIADDDIKNYLDFKKTRAGIKVGFKKNISELETKNIQQIQTGPNGEIRIKLYNRDNALIQLGRHTGLFNDQLTIKNNLEEVLKGISDRNKLSEEQLNRIAQIIFQEQKKFLK